MAGFDHGPNRRDDSETASEVLRNSRLGLRLFFVYLLLYSGFVLANAYAPQLMERTPVGGVNLAILFGFGLIGGAFLLALLYGWLCRRSATPETEDRRR